MEVRVDDPVQVLGVGRVNRTPGTAGSFPRHEALLRPVDDVGEADGGVVVVTVGFRSYKHSNEC